MEAKTAAEAPAKSPAIGASTLCEAFRIMAREFADRPAIRTRGDEFSCTWGEYEQRARALAAGFAALGLERGQTLAIMLTNRPEFHFVDAAAMHLGATPFSIYNTYSADQIEHLLRDSGARIVVTEQAFLENVLAGQRQVDSVEHVVVVDGEHEGTMTLDQVADAGDPSFDFEASSEAVQPDDIVTLIYTSGTTGPPKGVQLTHRNLCQAVRSYDEVIHFPVGGRVVSYLPMAHIAERNVSHYLPMLTGFVVTCCPNPRDVVSYLPEVHPSWFFAVPRIWEKLKAGLEAMLSGLEDEEQRERLQGALAISLERVRLIQRGEEVPAELQERWEKLDREVFAGLRTMLGLDQLYACHAGAAPTPPEVIEFFHALGVPLAELYGMSESSGAATCNPTDRIKIGTVGKPTPGIEVRLADDGEILIKSDVVMPGYRNEPEKTREAIDEDGWLHTGDIGQFDEDGYIKIVDRKKELIINAAGKNMSPANIESKLKSAGPLIGQAVAIGDRRPFNTALITLDPDSLPAFCKQHGLDDSDLEQLAQDEKVLEQVQREVDAANEQLARVEQIKKFKVLPVDWQPGGEELTPTMKLKRKPIAEKYADEIEALYAR